MRFPGAVAPLVFGLLVGIAPAAVAQPRASAFAGIPFGSRPAAVLAAMTARHLELRPSEGEDLFPLDQRFFGPVNGQPALITAYYDTAGHLEKMLVSFLTPDEECVSFYRAMKKELVSRHGKPAFETERWEFPYENGGQVGQEHIAIRFGKGLLATVWDTADAGSADGGITLRATDNVIVRLAYESSRWQAEFARRQKLLGDDADADALSSTPAGGTGSRRGAVSVAPRPIASR
jgi:hypothetical protein